MTPERMRVLLPLWLVLAGLAAYGPAVIAGPSGTVAGLAAPVLFGFVSFQRAFHAEPAFAFGAVVLLVLAYWSLATLITLWVGLPFSSHTELFLIVLLGILSSGPLILRRRILDS